MREEGEREDVAVAAGGGVDAVLASRPESTREVRSLARQVAEQLFDDEARIADVILAASELATNAVEHGSGTKFIFRTSSSEDRLCITVVSECLSQVALSFPLKPSPDVPSGRGLFIVDAVADDVEVEASGTRLAVTCTFRLGEPAG